MFTLFRGAAVYSGPHLLFSQAKDALDRQLGVPSVNAE